jgi:hypothetical protein
MPIIKTELQINAPIEICFDLARSIDIHAQSTSQTKEKAVGGVTGGLIEYGQSVTWEATHFGIKQRLTAKITEMEYRIVLWMKWLAEHSKVSSILTNF